MRWLICLLLRILTIGYRQRRKNEQDPSKMSKVLLLYLQLLLLLEKKDVWLVTMGKATAGVRLYALKAKTMVAFLAVLLCWHT